MIIYKNQILYNRQDQILNLISSIMFGRLRIKEYLQTV